MERITATIIALNEAAHIADCIESLKAVADEILVGDSGSSDDTVRLAEAAGAKVISLPWEGYGATKNRLSQVASHDWILSIDADERLSDELRKELIKLKSTTLQGIYAFPRKNFYGQKWIRYSGWYPDIKKRLYHRNEARWNLAEVHETLEHEASTSVHVLKSDLLHYTLRDRAHHEETIRKYARLQSERLKKSGKKGGYLLAVVHFCTMFLKKLILQGGILDGKEGFYVAWYSAKARWLKYVG